MKLIDYVISSGSIYEALTHSALTTTEVLSALVAVPERTTDHLIAYRNLCLYGGSQYLNGTHFLVQAPYPEYCYIYYLSGLPITTTKTPDSTETITSLLMYGVARISHSEWGNIIHQIADQIELSAYQQVNPKICLRSRATKYIDKFELTTGLYQSHYFGLWPARPQLYWKEDLVRFIAKTKKHDEYWTMVGRPLVEQVINHPQVPISLLLRIEDPRVEHYLPALKRLVKLDDESRKYYLNDYHGVILNDRVFDRVLKYIQTAGVEAYLEAMKSRTRAQLSDGYPDFFEVKSQLLNETDSYGVEVYDYAEHDLAYVMNPVGDYYVFTRPEWKQLMESEKNPYTNEKFTADQLREIRANIESGRKGECKPLSVMWEELAMGQVEVEAGKEEARQVIEPDIDLNNLFTNHVLSLINFYG